jgi:hypothetical protein
VNNKIIRLKFRRIFLIILLSALQFLQIIIVITGLILFGGIGFNFANVIAILIVSAIFSAESSAIRWVKSIVKDIDLYVDTLEGRAVETYDGPARNE